MRQEKVLVRFCREVALAAALLIPMPLAAQTWLFNGPSPVALVLAEALIDPATSQAEIDAVADELFRQLLNSNAPARGRTCDSKVAACSAAAAWLAQEEAPLVLLQRRAAHVQAQAVQIDDTMTPKQIAEAITFAHTPTGKALGRAFQRNTASLSPAAREKLYRIMVLPPPRPRI